MSTCRCFVCHWWPPTVGPPAHNGIVSVGRHRIEHDIPISPTDDSVPASNSAHVIMANQSIISLSPLGNIEHSFATLLPDGELVGMATFPQIGAKMQGDGDRDCDTVDSNNRPPPEDADMPPHSHQNVTTGGAALSGTPALGSPEALISLSHLNESISQQLVKFDSYPWDAPSAMQRLCSSKINTITDNPVAEALQTTTRFASILKSLSPSKSLETSSVPDSGVSVASSSHDGSIKGEINSRPGIAASSPLNTATYLLLLSSYLQLMHLFNVMFRRIAKFLGNMTEKAMSEFPQPEFRVTGLPPTMHSRLYLKILMQIIGHQLESVECLMGLSAEHCISGQAPLGKGIFSEQDVSNLLQAVLGQANSGRRLRRTVSEQPLIVSLRESIAVVQELLKG
ncbi:hypothetical protein C8A01DRAFT_41420 [Parachaetomium inaequale]|uniref:Uncharacterized protein n=1 Tax=Parachaetomium inaequale TaxID=2588326 RepID=A0AAN6P7A0_9PEZI|nr:hypothetical protein C8A01DRAFT_41420 [Parachaetomium inaequale]